MFEPMRYAALFGALGAMLSGAAARGALAGNLPGALAGGYLAACLLTMALIYALNARGIPVDALFVKPGWGRVLGVLLFPYRLLARTTLAVLARFDSMAAMDPVGTRLYVGRLPFPDDHAGLARAGVTSVLNLCAEFPNLSRLRGTPGLELAYLPVLDGAAPTQGQFLKAVEWVAARHAEGHSVLIHCAQGRGRSVTIAAAALCRLGLASDPEDALARITAARPRAKPSRKQRLALARFHGTDRAATIATSLLRPAV